MEPSDTQSESADQAQLDPSTRTAHPPADGVEQDALTAALIEIERYVARAGWAQPARLFALVPTAELLAAEPSLADQLHVDLPDALSSVEQDDFHVVPDLLTALSRIAWPPSVAGCALSVERSFLPAADEPALPEDPDEAELFVAEHPHRQDIRLVAGVLRDGTQVSVARLVTNPEELLVGRQLVPALNTALADTLN